MLYFKTFLREIFTISFPIFEGLNIEGIYWSSPLFTSGLTTTTFVAVRGIQDTELYTALCSLCSCTLLYNALRIQPIEIWSLPTVTLHSTLYTVSCAL